MKRVIQILKLLTAFMFLFELSRLYFVHYNSKVFEDSVWYTFVITAVSGFRLDLSAASYCLMPFLILFLIEFIVRRQIPSLVYKVILIIEFTLIFILTISDPELFLQWGNKFNNQVLVYITHPKEMALSAGSVKWVRTILFALVLIAFYIPVIKLCFGVFKQKLAFSWQYLSVTFLSLVVGFITLRGGVGVATISQASAIYSTNHACNAAAINSLWNAMYYLVNDTRDLYGNKMHFKASAEAKKELKNQLHLGIDELILTDSKRPNIIVVMLESFTASASHYFSGKNNCTPYLDNIANENLSFMQCYSSGDRTEKGLVAVNSGYPAQPLSSIIIFPDKVNHLNSLSKEVKRMGYKNSFIYGGDAEFASMKSYLLMHAFDFIVDKSVFPSKLLKSKWGAHDEEMYNKALEQCDAMGTSFYTLLLSLSSHEPFDVPMQSNDLPKDQWYGYKNSLRYADQRLGLFLEACKKKPWYSNTIIILVADHGHEIGLPDLHYFGKEKYHIPLVVTGGALKPALRGVKINNTVSQTIIPSLCMAAMGKTSESFDWQTRATDSLGFAQYAYNNGFGRVNKQSAIVFDNAGSSIFYVGKADHKAQDLNKGKVFQQVLIEDFLKK